MKTNETKLFFKQFFKKPLANASIIPSSKAAAKAIVQDINFSKADVIVELGPGTGCITEEILRHAKPKTKIILVEIETIYVNHLRKKFGNKIIIEQTSAHLLENILQKHNIRKIDVIISGLPFAMPTIIFQKIIASIKAQTDKGTILRYLTYMPPIMKRHYKKLPIQKKAFVLKNFPPLWVYGVN